MDHQTDDYYQKVPTIYFRVSKTPRDEPPLQMNFKLAMNPKCAREAQRFILKRDMMAKERSSSQTTQTVKVGTKMQFKMRFLKDQGVEY